MNSAYHSSWSSNIINRQFVLSLTYIITRFIMSLEPTMWFVSDLYMYIYLYAVVFLCVIATQAREMALTSQQMRREVRSSSSTAEP